MSRNKIIPSITVGDVKRLLATMDDRAEFKLDDGAGNPVAVRDIVRAIDNRGASIALVQARLE